MKKEEIFNMVIVRLSRGGSKKRPFFNIVVTDSRNRRDGRFLERLGFYNPVVAEGAQRYTINTERLQFWVARGAQLSDTVARIVKTNGTGTAAKAKPVAAPAAAPAAEAQPEEKKAEEAAAE